MSKIRLNGTSSGYTELAPPAAAGSNTITLPSSNGSANQFLKNGSTAGTLGWSSMVETATGVGIGTTSPGQKLVVSQNGAQGLEFNPDSATAFILAGYNRNTSQYINLDYQADNHIFRNGTSERARITSGGEVYIAGTTDQGAYNLQVNGTGVWGAGAYVNGSDERLKEDIQPLADASEVLQKLRPVSFKYKADYSRDQSIQPGFIAQELQEAMAGQVYLNGVVQQGPEYLNVAYQGLIPVLTKALQEALDKIASLEARITALEAA